MFQSNTAKAKNCYNNICLLNKDSEKINKSIHLLQLTIMNLRNKSVSDETNRNSFESQASSLESEMLSLQCEIKENDKHIDFNEQNFDYYADKVEGNDLHKKIINEILKNSDTTEKFKEKIKNEVTIQLNNKEKIFNNIEKMRHDINNSSTIKFADNFKLK